MKIPMNAVTKTVELLLRTEAKRTTKYLSPDLVISAQRKTWNNKINKRDTRIEVILKIGKPNYLEAEFIKKCKKAGEPFPIKKIQIKDFPPK